MPDLMTKIIFKLHSVIYIIRNNYLLIQKLFSSQVQPCICSGMYFQAIFSHAHAQEYFIHYWKLFSNCIQLFICLQSHI